MSITAPTRDDGVVELPKGEALASQLPVERIPPTSWRRVALISLSCVFIIIALNGMATQWLTVTVPNEGYRRIHTKWAMLENLSQPVDTLILGDSSGAQGVDPELLTKSFGGKSLNLGTVGDMTVVNSAAMLDEYVRKHGAPKRALVVQVFDVWPRNVTGYALAQSRLDADAPALAWFPRHGDPALRREMFLDRNVKLFSESKSLVQSVKDAIRRRTHRRGTGPRPDGFSVTLKPDRNQLNRDVKEHLATIGTMKAEISADNAAALAHLQELSTKYGFPVYVVNAPISERVLQDANFKTGYEKIIGAVSAELQRLGGTLIFPNPQQFPGSEMTNVDHLTYEGAQKYTSELIKEISRLEKGPAATKPQSP
ncbi:MAG: hypothetical protein QOJ65_304 [Fimbriimonadaceae bacterium]|jgi:hypothetical protein|nr:hypothetical protein [Fimbriimonadaceae bacterium]